MQKSYIIRAERPDDFDAVHDLHNAAFGPDAGIDALAADLRRLKAAFSVISLVAVDTQDRPKGHVMVSHAWVDAWDRLIDVMVLSPLGVHPDVQNQGIGTTLIKAALEAADAQGAPIVFLEGNNKYYGPRGFTPAVAHNIRRPSLRMPDAAFQMKTLSAYHPEMTGSFVYHDVHWTHGVGLYR